MWRHLAGRSASCKKAITAGLHHPPLPSSRARPTHRETILLQQDQYRRLFSSSVPASLAAYTPTETVEYEVDHLVIGAGVVGLAVAERLASRGAGSTLLVDKNPGAGQETRYWNALYVVWGFGLFFRGRKLLGTRLLEEANGIN